MTKVRLLQRFAIEGGAAFNVGEGVALDDALATSLITRKIAVRAYDAPPVDRMIVAAPTDTRSPKRGRLYVK